MANIPSLDTYRKGHVPKPIEIVERYADSDVQTIVREISGLTKLNLKSADFASAEPITLRFTRRVEGVMTELSVKEETLPHYRFNI
jgi:hypothetical protein